MRSAASVAVLAAAAFTAAAADAVTADIGLGVAFAGSACMGG